MEDIWGGVFFFFFEYRIRFSLLLFSEFSSFSCKIGSLGDGDGEIRFYMKIFLLYFYSITIGAAGYSTAAIANIWFNFIRLNLTISFVSTIKYCYIGYYQREWEKIWVANTKKKSNKNFKF